MAVQPKKIFILFKPAIPGIRRPPPANKTFKPGAFSGIFFQTFYGRTKIL